MSTNTYGALDSRTLALENAHFMSRVYSWMTTGILITFAVAYGVNQVPQLAALASQNKIVFFGLVIAQLGAVIYLSTAIKRMSLPTAMIVYLVYAGLVGLDVLRDLSGIHRGQHRQCLFDDGLLLRRLERIWLSDQRDLGPIGTFCTMGLFGLVGFMFVSMLFPAMRASGSLQQIASIAGVVIFAGLTAYDTQKVKALNVIGNEGTAEDTKEAIFGALVLYLDFINLFVMLLRLFGRRRN